MKRPNRSLEIFSISALDLFASALGAFILVAVILFPYYLKNWEVVAENKRLQEELQATRDQLQEARSAAAAERQRAAAAEARLAGARKQAESASRRAAAASKEAAAAESQAKQKAKVSTVFALLGINTQAKSFVILIDMSNSMRAYTRIMVDTIDRLLKPMEDDIQLTIIGFNAPFGAPELHPWTRGGELVAMTPEGKRKAVNYAQQLAQGFAGKTPTHAALREALRYPVEAIILLSDGAPTDNDMEVIIDDVTRSNGGRKEIHCVALGDYNKLPQLVLFLQELARRNGGDFTGVSG